MSDVRAVLFDAVGTLIAPDPPVAEAYHDLGRKFGSRRTLPEVADRFRQSFAAQEHLDTQLEAAACAHAQSDSSARSLSPSLPLPLAPSLPPATGRTSEARERDRWRSIVAHVFDDLPDTSELLAALCQHFAESRHWRLFDDVPAAWRELSRRDYVLGIASNFDQRLEAICDGLSPLANCRQRFVSSRLGFRKPSRQFFRAIEASLQLEPQQILLVGDDYENDYLGAQAAGWQTKLLSRGALREDLPSDSQICSLIELTR